MGGAVSIENVGAGIARPWGSDVLQRMRATNGRPYIQDVSLQKGHRERPPVSLPEAFRYEKKVNISTPAQ